MPGPATGAAHTGVRDPRGSVVKIFSTKQRPTWVVPWQAAPVESSTGSGAVIALDTRPGERYVLTAAHVVSDIRLLQVQRNSDRFSSEKFLARVVAICHEADLALLAVDNAEALQSIPPLEVAPGNELPRISDKVRVVGYPVGGAACSVTEGTVSRVEVQEFAHPMRLGLALTVDAAINSGNSGGPLIDTTSERVVGVALQKLVARGVELQGHAMPAPMLRRFLSEVAAKLPEKGGSAYRMRLPSLGCAFQTLEARSLRQSLGLQESTSGILTSRVHGGSVASLRAGDVLLAFDGLALDNLGFCDVLGQRLHFAAARDLRAVGDVVELSVWREGSALTVKHTLGPEQHLVPRGQYDCKPPFFTCGGLVFQPLSAEYLNAWGNAAKPTHLQDLLLRGATSEELQEVVVITQILADEINLGYGSGFVGAPIVKSVNGQKVRDLAHMVAIVREARRSTTDVGGFLRFNAEDSRGPYVVVLPLAGLDAADRRVSELYGAPSGSVHFKEEDLVVGTPQSRL